MRNIRLELILLTAFLPAADAQNCLDVDYGRETACSLTGVNGPCTIIVDRMRAATPPTIYVRRGETVILTVINRSPLEKLQLDETSINTQVPIDSVQALAPLLASLGQFALPLQQPIPAPPPQPSPGNLLEAIYKLPENPPPGSKSFQQIQQDQKDLSDKIRADTTLDPTILPQLEDALAVLRKLLVPPLDGCKPNSDWNVALARFPDVAPKLTAVREAIEQRVGKPETTPGGAGVSMADDLTKLAMIQADITQFANGMAAEQKESEPEITKLKKSNADLQKKIEEEQKKRQPDARLIQQWKDTIRSQEDHIEKKKKTMDDWQVQLEQLKAAQSALGDMLTKAQTLVKTVLFPAQIKLRTLVVAILQRPSSPTSFPINDLLRRDKNDQQEVFTLNAVNYLTDPVKIFIASPAADPYTQKLADSIVATAPAKTAVMQATVQYVTQPEMEVTAGVLVPFLPYKSYTAAPQSAGSATLVAQENHTYTIVPTVDLNFRLGNDRFVGNKRYGWFATVAVGYNPSTTMVEFGLGPSFALKSMVFSFLADIGRDTELASGFTKNQPLPGSATTPATNGVWSVKPSVGFSIRLPFNSGGGH